jgi:hypothetical protein
VLIGQLRDRTITLKFLKVRMAEQHGATDSARRAIAPYITKLDAQGIISSNNGFVWQQSHRIWDTPAGDNWNSLLTLDVNTVIGATSTNDEGEDRIKIRFGQLTSEVDEFNSTNLGGQWHWVQEDATKWSLSARSGYMRKRHNTVIFGRQAQLTPTF